jgi:hypothetical protein
MASINYELLIGLNNEIQLLSNNLNNESDNIKIIQNNISKLQDNIDLLLDKLITDDTIKNNIIYLKNNL